MLKTDAYCRLMEVASELSSDHYKHESAMEITESTNTIVGICFGHLYEQMWDDAKRNQLIEKVDEFSKEKLADSSLESKVMGDRVYSSGVSLPSFFINCHGFESLQVTVPCNKG